MRRGFYGMISFEHDGVHHLLMIGGMGSKPAVQLPCYKYIDGRNGRWATNEHSMYNLSLRKWSNPSITGQFIPAIFSFTINKISSTRAIVFGGAEITDDSASNNIYLLEISSNNVFWQCVNKPEAIDQWPVGRATHASAIIRTGSESPPMLVISGGINKAAHVLDDCYIFNITQRFWTKLDVPHSVSKRFGHTLSAFIMSPHCVWIIAVGGDDGSNDGIIQCPNIVMLTELVINSKGEWTVGDTLDSNSIGNEEYKTEYHQQLQLGRSKWLEECQKQRKRDGADIDQSTIQSLMENLRVSKAEKERDEQHFHLQLEQKERELQEKDGELQEKDRELQEKERELQESRDAVRIYQQQILTDDHWVIDKDEVTLTGVELGRGSYATVNIGIFRGLRVAVKSLHTIIISDYNLALFSREMSIASRVRHPNLVQFIGATKVGTPLILTELMNTSLHKELQKIRLTKQQILSIAQDVALGLNYLHLFKPQPIIHRDVSSPNVLLKPFGPAGYEAKVSDYGTANLQETTSTIMPGNAAYAAPEARDPEQHSPAMDVYSYSVLLMEMTLHLLPEMTLAKREQQAGTISWPPMKSLIQRGLNAGARPTMAQVIESLKAIKI
ncbi:PREDICTED: probable serine/threonine-protein kinase DDB_G0271682 [Amphimedon queenslandica]|uniref:Protein kinase domain-containing protein n=1 Tax=Amphimedon queenslandica TaxID=400682 RepID=A0AAN0JP49_AMPQE|nr:PREDICTED: probable serine/threonine-protein kinase DDB_G0271682 [Amphimedon queenslandica]|eukprot:XP_019858789.1 PREDICTED: probable serine/threonine-protein kinase DDB_G0271682 [Amphimedon queenslandica]